MPQNPKFSKAEINDYIDELDREISEFSDSAIDYVNEKPYEEITPKVDPELPGNIWFTLPGPNVSATPIRQTGLEMGWFPLGNGVCLIGVANKGLS